MSEIWKLTRGEGPVVALAIHDGHLVRPELEAQMALSDADRLMEEDPFTGGWAGIAPTALVALRSRFEVDLNRPRSEAVYLTPDDAWGLEVWREAPAQEELQLSLSEYDAFYDQLTLFYDELEQRYGRFLVLDLHSYNHRRDGPDAPHADPRGNPQINLGTGTMPDRERWADLIRRFKDDLRAYPFPGRRLDIRENVRFRGGYCARWTHERYPEAACVLSIEVKKFFMDEWTGVLDRALHGAVRGALRSAMRGALEELARP